MSKQLEFSYKDVDFKHHTADYYENKKYTFLKITIALLGFGATFINIFKDSIYLQIGGLSLVVFSTLIILYFGITSKPSKILTNKMKNKLTERDILNINKKRSSILSDLIIKKQKVVRNITYLMSLGIIIFFSMILVNFYIFQI